MTLAGPLLASPQPPADPPREGNPPEPTRGPAPHDTSLSSSEVLGRTHARRVSRQNLLHRNHRVTGSGRLLSPHLMYGHVASATASSSCPCQVLVGTSLPRDRAGGRRGGGALPNFLVFQGFHLSQSLGVHKTRHTATKNIHSLSAEIH